MRYLRTFESLLTESDALIIDDEGYARLYRGDSSDIDFFLFDKTDVAALFGQGFYFTTSTRIAKSYKIKGGESRLWAGDAKSREEAERLFIRQYLMFKVDPEVEQVYKDINDPEMRWKTYREKAPEEEYRARLYKARDLYDEMESRLVIKRFSKIIWQVIDREKIGGSLTTIRLPETYLDTCYNAEEPINPTILIGIRDILDELGDKDSQRYIDWEMSFIERHNVRQPDDKVTPTLRTVYVECISKKSPIRQVDGQRMFRKVFQDNGYTGIRYAGGKTIGAGVNHEAYVFWDEVAINGWIVKDR